MYFSGWFVGGNPLTRRPVVAVLPRHNQRRVDVGLMLGDNGRYWRRHIRRDNLSSIGGVRKFKFPGIFRVVWLVGRTCSCALNGTVRGAHRSRDNQLDTIGCECEVHHHNTYRREGAWNEYPKILSNL